MTLAAVTFNLDGEDRAEFVPEAATLLTLLRERIGEMSPKAGCKQGTCGTCSVLIDGELRLACITLAQDANGRRVETLAGLADNGRDHALQRAFVEGFASQCGFCTPGMIIAAKALLDRNPDPCHDEVVDAISGNFCRCTGYRPIVSAILRAATDLREQTV